jgi:hypothetical protein
VRAAIGSARADYLGFLAGDSANSFCQCALNCSQSSLRGPAAKIGSVVRDDEFYSFSQPVLARQPAHRRLDGGQAW